MKDNGTVVYEPEDKFWGEIKTLELLGKKLKLFVDKLEIEDAQDQVYRKLLKQLKEQK